MDGFDSLGTREDKTHHDHDGDKSTRHPALPRPGRLDHKIEVRLTK
jgi:ATP-dependent 26S proteasome regulatory subunit